MGRTSRRVSRPLIAGLGVVIVLGVIVTFHKVRHAGAVEPKKAAASVALAPAPAAPVPIGIIPAATQPAATAPQAVAPISAAADSAALITQTPTEKVSSTDASRAGVRSAVEDSMPAPGGATAAPAHADATAAFPAVASAASNNAGSAAAAAASASTSSPGLPDLKARAASGDLLAQRQELNARLASASPADAESIRKRIEEINQTVIFSPRKFPDDPWGGNYQVQSGERLGTIANKNSVSWEFLSRINGVTPRRLRSGQTLKVLKGPFHAVVYKHDFRMEIYLGNPGGAGSMYVTSFPVGLGKDNSTPTGLWLCKAGDKIRNPQYYPPRGGDVLGPNDPKNPLAGYWIAIEGVDGQAVGKESYGIHGTIEPESIGKMSSMGCIRLRAADISWVFDLLVDGKSKVLIKD